MLYLDEDESFSLTANITNLGYQTMVLHGFLVKKEGGETYVAPLLPQMFYGADGQQLGASWRQYLTAGSHIILSRSGGEPEVPREELYWRRIGDGEERGASEPMVESYAEPSLTVSPVTILTAVVAGATVIGLVYWLSKR